MLKDLISTTLLSPSIIILEHNKTFLKYFSGKQIDVVKVVFRTYYRRYCTTVVIVMMSVILEEEG